MTEESTLRVQPRQARSAATINRVLDAAVTVLNKSGRDNLRMQDVAAESGVAIGTVYRYFPDRTALLDYLWPDRRDSYLPVDHVVPYIQAERSKVRGR